MSNQPLIQSAHSLILNRLRQMQRVPDYARDYEELKLAEVTILQLECTGVRLESDLSTAQERIKKLEEERERRVYYQNIVYAVCNLVDKATGKAPGHEVVCGTKDTPSTELQDTLAAHLSETGGIIAALEAAIAKEFTAIDSRSPVGDLLEEFGVWIDHHAEVEKERNSLKSERDKLQQKLEVSNRRLEYEQTHSNTASRAHYAGQDTIASLQKELEEVKRERNERWHRWERSEAERCNVAAENARLREALKDLLHATGVFRHWLKPSIHVSSEYHNFADACDKASSLLSPQSPEPAASPVTISTKGENFVDLLLKAAHDSGHFGGGEEPCHTSTTQAVSNAPQPYVQPAGLGATPETKGESEPPIDTCAMCEHLTCELDEAIAARDKAEAELKVAKALLNAPELLNFRDGVVLEAAHQRQRWDAEHDGGKTPADWFWLVGYLAGKALHAHVASNAEKALHHTISTAAALANWHASILGKTNMRPGLSQEKAEAIDPARKEAR